MPIFPINGTSPRVSVVLPTYNQAQFLPEALDSILNQTWRDFELIVVNDGSTDRTREILDDYRRRYGFLVIHQRNEKLPRALNRGFEQTRGDYLTWTSSDNVMLPDMLETLVAALDGNPGVALVYADWEVIGEDGELAGTVNTFDHDRRLLMRVNYINACFMYRRACQELIGLYDPAYLYAEDWEYWWRIARSFQLMHVPKTLYQYRIHGGSLTETRVFTEYQRQSVGYRRLVGDFRSHVVDWYLSKLRWEWLRLKLGRDPLNVLKPQMTGKPNDSTDLGGSRAQLAGSFRGSARERK